MPLDEIESDEEFLEMLFNTIKNEGVYIEENDEEK